MAKLTTTQVYYHGFLQSWNTTTKLFSIFDAFDLPAKEDSQFGQFGSIFFALVSFTNCVDKFLAFFDHLPPSVDIFYIMNVDKKSTYLDYLKALSQKILENFYVSNINIPNHYPEQKI